MLYGYHLILCLFLIIVQTTLLAGGGAAQLYDLLAPLVVYLGVYHPPRRSIPVLVLGGLAMDGISGGVFGVHLTAYLWMYVGVRWAIQFLQVGNVILLPLLVTAGVLFESLVVAFSAVVLASAPWSVESILPVVSGQVLWGAVTGPLLMLFFIRGQSVADRARRSFFTEKSSSRKP
jgi:rod shape-determining protein MreD